MCSSTGSCRCSENAFRSRTIRYLIIRHIKSIKSQPIKADDRTFVNHLNTIHLNKRPRSYDRPEPRKTSLSLRGKHVLVVDDIMTSGRRFRRRKGLHRGDRRERTAFRVAQNHQRSLRAHVAGPAAHAICTLLIGQRTDLHQL